MCMWFANLKYYVFYTNFIGFYTMILTPFNVYCQFHLCNCWFFKNLEFLTVFRQFRPYFIFCNQVWWFSVEKHTFSWFLLFVSIPSGYKCFFSNQVWWFLVQKHTFSCFYFWTVGFYTISAALFQLSGCYVFNTWFLLSL